jgi:hypothetical protein
MTDIKGPARGKYVKLEDVQYADALIQHLGLYRLSPPKRPKILINGSVYPLSEVARRRHRAERSGTWFQESNRTTPLSGNIRIVFTQTNSSRSDVFTKDDGQKFWNATSNVQFTGQNEQMDNSSLNFPYQLFFLDDKRMSPTLSDPKELRNAEGLCHYISEYLRRAHEDNLFISNDAGELVSRSSAESFTNLSNFYKCCIVALDLWEKQYWHQGYILLCQALRLVEIVLDEQDPKLLDVLCDLCILLPTKGWGRVYDLLQDKLCSMVEMRASKKHEQQHPWAQIFTCIRRLPSTEVAGTLQQSWKCGFDHLAGLLPEDPWDALNISCYSNYQLRIGNNVQYHWDTLLAQSDQLQRSDASDTQRQFARGKIFHLRGNHREALNIMEHILSHCDQARQQGDTKWMPMEIEALEVSARCHFAIHKLEPNTEENAVAERLLGDALEMSTTAHGHDSATTIALQHTLWLWFREQDRRNEADQLRKTIDDAVGRIEELELS